jgi:hypothetical protein
LAAGLADLAAVFGVPFALALAVVTFVEALFVLVAISQTP